MSSSQAPISGQPPSRGPPPLFRRPKADPLVRKRPAGRALGAPAPRANVQGPPRPARESSPLPIQAPRPSSPPPNEPHKDYPLFTTKKALLENLRQHVIRFMPNASAEQQSIDPTAQGQFTRPLRLHRRDPKLNTIGPFIKEGDDAKPVVVKTEEDKDKERLAADKAQRQAERDAIASQIAPADKSSKKPGKKSVEQVFQRSSHKQKYSVLKYEETLPWHLEDFDNKHIWQGTYESSLSDTHMMILRENVGQANELFRMAPLEKWYKFTPKNLFKAINMEEAEAHFGKKARPERWFMGTQQQAEAEKRKLEARTGSKLFMRSGMRGEERRVKDEDDDERQEIDLDADDLDYDATNDFADDEENALFDAGDDETKEAEEKIKREQLAAAVFNIKEEKDFDAEEEQEKARLERLEVHAKKMEKSLRRREKHFQYGSDEDDSDDPEEEEERLKKEEEAKKAAENGDEKASLSESGRETPSGRPKTSDPLRKSLKRSGSPGLSEMSGNESSSTRKKMKKKHPLSQQSSTLATASSISRPASPTGSQTSSSVRVKPNAAGSLQVPRQRPGTDAINSRSGSPGGSRAGSPVTPAGSPPPPGKVLSEKTLPTVDQLVSSVPPEGMPLTAFLKQYKGLNKVPGFTNLIKSSLKHVKRTVDGKEVSYLEHRSTASPRAASPASPA